MNLLPHSLQKELHKQIDAVFADNQQCELEKNTTPWCPAMDMFELSDRLTLTLELPGVNPQKIDVQVISDKLVIRGERSACPQEQGRILKQHQERAHGEFQRELTLPRTVEPERATATYRNGLLTVTIPKGQKETTRIKLRIAN